MCSWCRTARQGGTSGCCVSCRDGVARSKTSSASGLAERRHRDRVEYRLGANAERIVRAAAEARTIPFARIEDQESIPVS